MTTDNGTFYNTSKMAFFVGSMLLVVLVDQLTKMAAIDKIESSASLVNTHIAAPAVVFGPLAVCTTLWALILVRAIGNNWPLLAVPVSLIMGGALSNIGEATVQGAVTDFIRVGPIATNVADLAMIVGVLSLLLIAPYIYTRRRCYSARWSVVNSSVGVS